MRVSLGNGLGLRLAVLSAALCLGAATTFWSGSVAAADDTRVAAVQLPAWVERGGKIIALRPGMKLEPGDAVITGGRGRVHVDTPDGSIVKLGSEGRLVLDQLAVRSDAQGSVFDGALRVLSGAFRFTTRAVSGSRRRNVRVTVGVVTAGVRGTDIWGKSDDEKDLICLLEGRISVASTGQPEQTMDQANTFYVVQRGRAPNPIAPVDPAKIANEWAPQTELAPDVSPLTASGRWAVVAASHDRQDRAERLANALIDKGYPAEVVPAEVNGRTWFRVVIRGFGSRGDASAFAFQLEGVAEVTNAWIVRM